MARDPEQHNAFLIGPEIGMVERLEEFYGLREGGFTNFTDSTDANLGSTEPSVAETALR